MSSAEIPQKNLSQETSERQRMLLAHMDEGFAVCEMLYDAAGAPCDYRFLEVNDAFEQQTGLRSADILGKTALELFPDVERTWIEKFGKVATTGGSERFENFNHNTARYYETFAYSPDRATFILLIRDITSRKRSERSVSESETRLRLALEVGRMATWSSNYVTGEYVWDEAMIRLLGYPPGVKASYQAWAQRVHPEDLPRVEATLRETMRLGSDFSAEYRVFSRNDAIRWVEARGRVESNEYGTVTRSYGVMIDITDRKLAELSIHQSEARLRLALEAGKMAMWDSNKANEGYVWDEAMIRLLGYQRDTVQPSYAAWARRVHPEDLAWAEGQFRASVGQGGDFCSRYRVLSQNDEIRWTETRGRTESDANGNIVRSYGVMLDVTEQKRLEEELRLTTERFEAALRNSPVVVFNQDLDLRYTWIYNPALGYEASEVRGKRDLDIFERGQDAAITEQIKWTVMHTGVSQRQEVTIHWQGVDRCYDLMVDPQLDQGGRIVGVRCACIDITERKQAEQALKGAAEKLSIALEASQSGFFDWDLVDGRVTWSPELERLYGLTPGTFDGSVDQWRTWIHPEDVAHAEACGAEAIRTGELKGEWRIVDPQDGRVRWLSGRGKVLYDDSGSPVRVVGINVDITEAKRAQEALLRSEKLASVGRMASTVAHEINNPLGAITNLLYLAGIDKDLPPAPRQYIATAEAEVRRIAQVTRRALGFYREFSVPVPTRINQFLELTLDALKARVDNKKAVIRRSSTREFELHAVPGELQQIFSNILANSLDAIDTGGIVRIKVSPACDPKTAKRCVRITIADNGSGIAPNAQRQIFEPFFTTKGAVGTGLGLWVTRELIDKHGGTIRMRTAIAGARRGTSFSITLPVHPGGKPGV